MAGNLGQSLLEMNRPDEAIAPLRRAVAAAERLPADAVEAEHYLLAQANLGRALHAQQQEEEAYSHLAKALERLEDYRTSFLPERSNLALTKRFGWVYEVMIACCAALGRQEAARRTEAFRWAETAKWRLLTVVLRFLPLRLQEMPPEDVQAEERSLLGRLFGLLADPSSAVRVPEAGTIWQRLQRIWNELEPGYPDYVRIRRQQAVRAADAAGLLDDEVPVLVEYYLGEEYGTALAFVLHKGATEPEVLRLETTLRELQGRVADLLPGSTRVSVARFQEAAHWFYRKIVEPVLPLVPEGAGVCIVPAGPLHNAPFAALYDGHRYWIERNPIVVAPSATALRWWVSKNSRHPRRCLIFTATKAGTAKRDLDWFERLARREIAPLFSDPPATVVPPTQATKQRLLRELAYRGGDEAWDVVHIASHGVFEREKPFESHLELAGDSSNGERNLTVMDVFTGCRPDATLITLSACESGTAQTSTGDEMIGLAPAFLFGGASTVLASLWYVRQDVGVAITRRFYAHWMGSGRATRCSKIRAFHRALMETIEQKWCLGLCREWPHPHLWASFQLNGDWR